MVAAAPTDGAEQRELLVRPKQEPDKLLSPRRSGITYGGQFTATQVVHPLDRGYRWRSWRRHDAARLVRCDMRQGARRRTWETCFKAGTICTTSGASGRGLCARPQRSTSRPLRDRSPSTCSPVSRGATSAIYAASYLRLVPLRRLGATDCRCLRPPFRARFAAEPWEERHVILNAPHPARH